MYGLMSYARLSAFVEGFSIIVMWWWYGKREREVCAWIMWIAGEVLRSRVGAGRAIGKPYLCTEYVFYVGQYKGRLFAPHWVWADENYCASKVRVWLWMARVGRRMDVSQRECEAMGGWGVVVAVHNAHQFAVDVMVGGGWWDGECGVARDSHVSLGVIRLCHKSLGRGTRRWADSAWLLCSSSSTE